MRRVLLIGAVFALWAGPAHAATRFYSSGDLHAAIPDGGVLEHTIRVSDAGPVAHVEVGVRLDHPRDSDLTLTLVSPSGTEVGLSRKRGGGGANYGDGARRCNGNATVFEDGGTPLTDDAPPFVEYEIDAPEEPLRRLLGEQAKGRWTLRIEDDTTGNAGTLFCWWLDVSRDVTEYRRAARGQVRAVLSYKEDGGFYRDARLEIDRAGIARLDAPVRRLRRYYARPVRLLVRDLDADGDPEVVLDVYTNGAHCCTQSLIYRYERVRHRYTRTLHDWGNAYPTYRIVDADRDGHPELRSVDDRFAYVFTAFAGSFFPVRIWRFEHGRLLDVTRRFPAQVSANAGSLWKDYLSFRRQHIDVRGALAAWLADEYLLGREEEGWRRLETAYRHGELGPKPGLGDWPQGRAYLKALRAYLGLLGYARK
jgi:subtilisin-like proprotein convertase family protein